MQLDPKKWHQDLQRTLGKKIPIRRIVYYAISKVDIHVSSNVALKRISNHMWNIVTTQTPQNSDF